jgi:hypothetical protein
MLENIILFVLAALESKTASYNFGAVTVTATDVGGNPVHLSFGELIVVAERVFGGATGTFQIGDIQVTITPNESLAVTMTPQNKALHDVLAAHLQPVRSKGAGEKETPSTPRVAPATPTPGSVTAAAATIPPSRRAPGT